MSAGVFLWKTVSHLVTLTPVMAKTYNFVGRDRDPGSLQAQFVFKDFRRPDAVMILILVEKVIEHRNQPAL